MIAQLLEGAILVTLTVAIHGVVLGGCFRRIGLGQGTRKRSTLLDTWLLSRLAIWAVLAHLAEIALWGLFYDWRGIMPGAEISFYFSAVTYATIGYGDVTPPNGWRLLAAIEGLTGILMCAWSGGFLFAVVRSLRESSPEARPSA